MSKVLNFATRPYAEAVAKAQGARLKAWRKKHFPTASDEDDTQELVKLCDSDQLRDFFRCAKFFNPKTDEKELVMRQMSKHFHKLGVIHVQLKKRLVQVSYIARFRRGACVTEFAYADNTCNIVPMHFNHEAGTVVVQFMDMHLSFSLANHRLPVKQVHHFTLRSSEMKKLHLRRKLLAQNAALEPNLWGIVCEYAEPIYFGGLGEAGTFR